ncbi:MAG TPA: lysophospholipid acyltransferase family protein [Candidatus Polarisedimenticolaceae bacterium]|nr:lysophospholipid acyltransferase family protein [Candidatus Polarisedimenticolaceae bacterium]
MLRGLLTLATLVVATLVLGFVGTVGGLFAPGTNFGFRIGRLWSRACLAAAGIRPTFTGLEHAAGVAPRLFLANHLSIVDIWVMAVCLPETTRFVAKRSLFFVPFLGQAMWAAGFIPIDRGDRTQAIKSLGRAAARIGAGASVILFPEGTRSRNGKLAPFKKGSFHLALETRVPIVPIAISGTYSVVKPRSIVVTPGPVHVTLFPPIDPSTYGDDVVSLMNRVRATIATGLAPEEL